MDLHRERTYMAQTKPDAALCIEGGLCIQDATTDKGNGSGCSIFTVEERRLWRCLRICADIAWDVGRGGTGLHIRHRQAGELIVVARVSFDGKKDGTV